MKVKITLSKSELESLFGIMKNMVICKEGLEGFAAFEVLSSFMMKLQRRVMNIKKKQTLSLTMAECFFIYKRFIFMMHAHTVYERILMTKIINIIHQKTI